jgi:hypothetical protein
MTHSKKIIAALVCVALAMVVSFVVLPLAAGKGLGGNEAPAIVAEAGGEDAEKSEATDGNAAGGAGADKAGAHSLSSLNGLEGAIALSFEKDSDSLSGKLRSGDIISVFGMAGEQIVSPKELKYLYVLAGGSKDDASGAGASDAILLANETQALKLSRLEAAGKLKVYLVYRGDAKTSEEYLDKQREVFNSREKQKKGE